MSFDFASERANYHEHDYAEAGDDNYLDSETISPRRHALPLKRLVLLRPSVKRIGWVQATEDKNTSDVLHQLVEQIRLKYLQLSNLERLIFSDEYMAIIGLGPRAVPILLADMQTGVVPWFWALKAITRENIGSEVSAGDFRALRNAWLEWGKKNGLV